MSVAVGVGELLYLYASLIAGETKHDHICEAFSQGQGFAVYLTKGRCDHFYSAEQPGNLSQRLPLLSYPFPPRTNSRLPDHHLPGESEQQWVTARHGLFVIFSVGGSGCTTAALFWPLLCLSRE